MVGKRDPFSVWRNFRVTYPVDAVEQHLAYRILQTPMIIFRHITNDRHGVAIRRPLGVLHVVQYLVWRSTAQRNPRQRSTARVAAVIYGVEPDRQFSAFGDREQ